MQERNVQVCLLMVLLLFGGGAGGGGCVDCRVFKSYGSSVRECVAPCKNYVVLFRETGVLLL